MGGTDARDAVHGGGDEEWEPDEGEELGPDDPRVKMWPDVGDVVSGDQPWLTEVLSVPLAVDLAGLHSGEEDWLPLPLLYEPYQHKQQGELGRGTKSAHDEHAGHQWAAFAVDAGGRLRFLGNERFFLSRKWRHSGAWSGSEAELEHAEEQRGREEAARRWRGKGRLERPHDRVLSGWGGETWPGNWVGVDPPAAYRLRVGDDGVDVSSGAGDSFRLVGSLQPWTVGSEAPYEVVYLFEQTSRTLLLTLEY